MSNLTNNSNVPKSLDLIYQMLNKLGIKDFDTQFIENLTDLSSVVTSTVLFDEAKALADFAGKKQIEKSDIEFTVKALKEKYKPKRPSKLFLMELAAQKNSQLLVSNYQNFDSTLASDNFLQTSSNLKTKLSNQFDNSNNSSTL